MPLVNDENCGKLANVIYRLVKSRKEEEAAKLLRAFAFDPIRVVEALPELERMVTNGEEHGIRDKIRFLPNPDRTGDRV